jgi:hypothetical protein
MSSKATVLLGNQRIPWEDFVTTVQGSKSGLNSMFDSNGVAHAERGLGHTMQLGHLKDLHSKGISIKL